jgi:outer membrane protein OmpA-like peptidoglycan-associated protein
MVATASLAQAQQPRESIEVERFKPALTWDGFAVTEGTDVRGPEDPVQLGVAANGAINPLVGVDADGAIVERFVAQRAGVDLFGSITLARGLALGVGLPLFFLQDGDGDPNRSGVGDLRVLGKLRLLEDRGAVGLALLAELRAPTHSDDEYSGGAPAPIFAPRVALDHRFPFGVRVGGNLGLLLRQSTQFENIVAGSELTYSAAAVLPLGGDEDLAVGVDFHGGAGLRGLDAEELPLEAQLFLQADLGDQLQLQLGPGFGIVGGYGTPTARLYAASRWSPTRRDRARPAHAAPAAGVRVTVIDPDGHPIDRAEARLDDTRAGPTDEPGVLAVEAQPGTHELWVRAQGFLPQRVVVTVSPGGTTERTVTLEPIRIAVTDDRIEFSGTVYFAFDRADLLDESHDLLDEIALVIRENPSLRLVRVEGHTDQHGDDAFNQHLSEARAASVVAYLAQAGVEPGRLEAVGYGESRPISKLDEENRRVAFVIVKGRLPGAAVEE